MIITISVLLLTGCFGGNTETLRCSFNMEDAGISINAVEIIDIRNGRLVTREMTIQTIAADMTMDMLEEHIANTIDSERNGFGQLRGMAGVTYLSEMRSGYHFLDVLVDYREVDESEIRRVTSQGARAVFHEWDQRISVELTRSLLESQGYICE